MVNLVLVFMLCEIGGGCGIIISFGHWCVNRVVGVLCGSWAVSGECWVCISVFMLGDIGGE